MNKAKEKYIEIQMYRQKIRLFAFKRVSTNDFQKT